MIPPIIQNSKFKKRWLNFVGNILMSRYLRILKYVTAWLTLWFTQLKYYNSRYQLSSKNVKKHCLIITVKLLNINWVGFAVHDRYNIVL